MNDGSSGPGTMDLRRVAAATAVAIGTVAVAAIVYLLLDILLLLFLGIVVAAALRPAHVVLCRWGIPKGLAVLLIYLFLLIGFALTALLVGPVLVEQIGTFAAEVPATYARLRSHLLESAAPLRVIGNGLPPFEHLAGTLPGVAPQLYQGAVGVTTSLIKLGAFFVAVLAIGFYWTMEVPRFERLLLSLLAVRRRPRALDIWHEIESKLGGFIRGQGLAMVAIGAASAIGYALIGLPNVLALAVLAGLLEAVPLIGPVLAVGPAILVALPLGLHTVLLVIGLAMVLQLIESNVLIPRIMHHTVGVSALVGLLAVLAFGTLYGVAGILIAIPITAVIQVLLERMLVEAEPQGLASSPWAALRARVGALRHEARGRLRSRSSRIGIDPATADYAVDAADQQIEEAAARVEKILSVAQQTAAPLAAGERAAMVDKLSGATEEIERALAGGATSVTATEGSRATSGLAPELPPAAVRAATGQGRQTGQPVETAAAAGSHAPARDAESEGGSDSLDRATRRIREAVRGVETIVVAAQQESREAHAVDGPRHMAEEIEEAIEPVTTIRPAKASLSSARRGAG